MAKENPKTVAMPPLGCGNGGLRWSDVKDIILFRLAEVENDYDFSVYEPVTKSGNLRLPKLDVDSLLVLKLRLMIQNADNLRLQKGAFFFSHYLGRDYYTFDGFKYGSYSKAVNLMAHEIADYQKSTGS